MLNPEDVEIDAIVVGGSLGAIDALSLLVPELPQTARVPVIVVVHLPPHRQSLLSELFAPRAVVPVREPNDKDPITPGLWFAPPDYHLMVESGGYFALSTEEPLRHSRPSIDVLFESAADVFGPRLAAVVITGANEDGAAGARLVKARGGVVIVQSPETAAAPQMPLAAIAATTPDFVLPLPEIGKLLRVLTRG